MDVTQIIACCQISSVLSFFSRSKNYANGMLCGKMRMELKLIFIAYFNLPDVFLYNWQVAFWTWIS